MYLKELRYYFTTPIAYIVIGLYQLALSLMLWVIPGSWNIADSGYASAAGLFYLSPWLLMILTPALTMRLFAEEKQNGTWQLLLSKPVSRTRIVLGKYFAAWTVLLLAQLPCFLHLFLISSIAEPQGNVDTGAFLGSMIGLMLISMVFAACGTLCSVLTTNQITAFVAALIGCFILFYGFDLAAMLFSVGRVANIISWCSLNIHYQSIARGVLDISDFVYMLSVSTIMLAISIKYLCCRT